MCGCVFASVRYRSGENNYYSISMDTYVYVCSSKCRCTYSNVCFKGMLFCFLSKFVVVLM